MESFIDKLIVEYPIPLELSCWSSESGYPEITSLTALINACVDELASDLTITAHLEANGITTIMPEGTITCTSAMLSSAFPFQGNRLVKVTYDASSRKAFLRYYPAIITYIRSINIDDLLTLKGDRLIYIKSYILWKMAEKDIAILETASMSIDNGSLNLDLLKSFRDSRRDKYEKMKEDILIYSAVN